MESLTVEDNTRIIHDLIQYRLVQYIRKKKLKDVTNTLLAGCLLLIPTDISLPIGLKKKDIRI